AEISRGGDTDYGLFEVNSVHVNTASKEGTSARVDIKVEGNTILVNHTYGAGSSTSSVENSKGTSGTISVNTTYGVEVGNDVVGKSSLNVEAGSENTNSAEATFTTQSTSPAASSSFFQKYVVNPETGEITLDSESDQVTKDAVSESLLSSTNLKQHEHGKTECYEINQTSNVEDKYKTGNPNGN
ncbi:MAG: hypothetical protein AAFN93_09355, partial [Bacteroidota bacterium]